MSDPKTFVARSASRRRVARRSGKVDRRADGEGKNLPVVTEQPAKTAPEPDTRAAAGRRAGVAAFAAQILGQDGQKRGLRGGPETLDKARTSYLGTEWSGPADRRPPAGRITKTDI